MTIPANESPAPFYHVCFVVPDLPAAMRELSAAANVQWGAIRTGTLGDWQYELVISSHSPHIELISGPPGSPWDASQGPRFDHLGWWSQDLEYTTARWERAGLPASFDACPLGRRFAYFDVPSIGARIEAVDASGQAAFHQAWSAEHARIFAALDPTARTT